MNLDASNWFGRHNGAFFGEPPAYVDKTKEPGRSMIPVATPLQWMMRSPFVLITSPNFVWACIALATYYFFPYDLTTSVRYCYSRYSNYCSFYLRNNSTHRIRNIHSV